MEHAGEKLTVGIEALPHGLESARKKNDIMGQ
jgi:hypothetical protein